MMLKNFSKEYITAGFYVIYLLICGICYIAFPGDTKTPNIGVLFLFLLVPISFGFAVYHVIKHFNSEKNYTKCLFIHVIAWFSIIGILSNYAK